MSSSEKKALFGTRQEAILTPKLGYEVESVEIFNKSTNEIVPSQLVKTSDNPPQWVCSFVQPAGIVALRPKMKPVYFSVIIESCENCNIVLLESNDVVDVKVAAANGADRSEDGAPEESAEAGGDAGASPEDEESDGDDDEDPAHGEAALKEEDPVNFNQPQHSDEEDADAALDVEEHEADADAAEGVDDADAVEGDADAEATERSDAAQVMSDKDSEGTQETQEGAQMTEDAAAPNEAEESDAAVVDETAETESESSEDEDAAEPEKVDESKSDAEVASDGEGAHDCVYDAGEFEDELKEVEPTFISRDEFNRKCKIYWQYREKFNAGRINADKFNDVKKKHSDFMDEISAGRIVIQD